MRWLLRLIVLTMMIALSGCATSQAPATDSGSSAFAVASQSAQPKALPGANDDTGDYRIGALDMLEITVFKVPELSKTLQVSSVGEIRLPLIGTLPAAGKTARQLEADITKRLEADYLQSAQVGVFVQDAVSQRITVEGSVRSPGIFPTTKGQTTLLQVIALAGGPTRLANERQILVFRQIDGNRNAAIFDYTSIRSGKEEDPIIHGGDIVVVDQSGAKAAWRGLLESISVIRLFTPIL